MKGSCDQPVNKKGWRVTRYCGKLIFFFILTRFDIFFYKSNVTTFKERKKKKKKGKKERVQSQIRTRVVWLP